MNGNEQSKSGIYLEPGQDVTVHWALQGWENEIGSVTPEYGAGFFLEKDGEEVKNASTWQEIKAPTNTVTISGNDERLLDSGSYTIPGADINSAGTYRVVGVLAHIDEWESGSTTYPDPTDIDDGTQEYYFDTDNNSTISGGVGDPYFNQYDTGEFFDAAVSGIVRTSLDPQTLTVDVSPNQGYSDNPTVTLDLSSTNVHNAKDIKVGIADAADAITATPSKLLTSVVNSTGDDTVAYNIDTDFPQAATNYQIRVALGAYLGDTSTPAGEKADDFEAGGGQSKLTDDDDETWTTLSRTTFIGPLDSSVGSRRRLNIFGNLPKWLFGGGGVREGSLDDLGEGFDSGGRDTFVYRDEAIFAGTGDLAVNIAFDESVGSFGERLLMGGDSANLDSSTGKAFEIRHVNNSTIDISWDGTVTNFNASSSSTYSNGTDFAISVKRDDTARTLKVWVNDVLEIDTTYTSDQTPASSGNLMRAGSEVQPPIKLKELRFWTTTLPSDADMKEMSKTGTFSFDGVLEGNEDVVYFFTEAEQSLIDDTGVGITALDTHVIEDDTVLSVGHDVTVDTFTINSQGGATLYNRGETFDADVTFNNVHGASITPNSTVLEALASNSSTEFSSSAQNSPYNLTYSIGNTDLASWDTTGDQKNLQVAFGHYGAKDPTFSYETEEWFVSRFWEVDTGGAASITPGAGNDAVFTGKSQDPSADDVVDFNRGQSPFFNTYVYNARGEKLSGETVNANVRPIGSETFDETTDFSVNLVTGQFKGASATYTIDTNEATGEKALVIGNSAMEGSNAPRTGLGGNGNFAETNTTTGEWEVFDTYTVVAHLQLDDNNLDPLLDTDQRATSSLGFYSAKVTDANGDPVNGATGDLRLQDEGALVNAIDATGLTTANVNGNDGYVPLQPWDSQLPGGVWDLWTPSGNEFTKDGNTGTLAQGAGDLGTGDFSLTAANPNLTLITGGGPAGAPAKQFEEGDAFLAGLAALNTKNGENQMVEIDDGSAEVAIVRLNTATGRAQYLDSDESTWVNIDPESTNLHFFSTTESIDDATLPPKGSEVYTRTFATTTGWGDFDIFVVGRCLIGGLPLNSSEQVMNFATPFLPLAGGTMSGDIDMGDNNIDNVDTIDGGGDRVEFNDDIHIAHGNDPAIHFDDTSGDTNEEVAVGLNGENFRIWEPETGDTWLEILDAAPGEMDLRFYGDRIVMNEAGGNLDLNNWNINDVASIDGNGDPVVFDDDINLNGNNLDNVASIDNGGSAIGINDDLDFAGGNDILNLDAIASLNNINSGFTINGNLDVEGILTGDVIEEEHDEPFNTGALGITQEFFAAKTTTVQYGTIQETNIYVNDDLVAQETGPATGTFSVTQGDRVWADAPTSFVDDTEATSLLPLSWAGTKFVYNITRFFDHTVYVFSPFSPAHVEMTQDDPSFTSPTELELQPGEVGTFTVIDLDPPNEQNTDVFIKSDAPIVVVDDGDGGDIMVIPPASREVLHSFPGAIRTFDGSAAPSGGAYMTNSVPFSSTHIGDGDGSDADMGVPYKLCGDTYIIPHALHDYGIVAIEPCVVRVYEWDGADWVIVNGGGGTGGSNDPNLPPSGDHVFDLTAATRNNPLEVEIGDQDGSGTPNISSNEPFLIVGTAPFYLRTNDPSNKDEYPVTGFRQSKYSFRSGATPVVKDANVAWTTDQDPATSPVTTSHRHIAGTEVAQVLSIDQYKRDPGESFRNFTDVGGTDTGYVRAATGGNNMEVTGTSEDGGSPVEVTWRGTTYVEGVDSELVVSSGSWTLTVDPGAETSSAEVLTVDQAGQISQTAEIHVDRTAPTVTTWEPKAGEFGDAVSNELYRGEYVRFDFDYSDDNVGVDTATLSEPDGGLVLSSGTPLDNNDVPDTQGGATGTTPYARTENIAGLNGDVNRRLQLTVTDLAGNSVTADATVYFTTLPTNPTATLAITSSNESPNTVFHTQRGETSYDDDTVTGDITLSGTLSACRNSANDDTVARIDDASASTLEVNQFSGDVFDVTGSTNINGVSANVNNASSGGLGRKVRAEVDDQYYRTINSPDVGNFDYNDRKDNDLDTDPGRVAAGVGFSNVGSETYYDADTARILNAQATASGTNVADNAKIIDGQAEGTAAGGFVENRIDLTGNNNDKYRIKLVAGDGSTIATAGDASSAGLSVEYKKTGAGSYNSVDVGQTFTVGTAETQLDVKVIFDNGASSKKVEGVYVEFLVS